MRLTKNVQHGLVALTAVVVAGGQLLPGAKTPGPAATAVAEFAASVPRAADSAVVRVAAVARVTGVEVVVAKRSAAETAVDALAGSVRELSHPRALQDAFRSYFAFKAAHPERVRKPYLYFVDYGLPSTAPRGYVFDMEKLELVEGPFNVAHGRGSSKARLGVPTRFSNAPGSAATSLGLYLAQETYAFSGKSAGQFYTSIGLRLQGLSSRFNDQARARGVVAHGAPYVSASAAGRSEGCPALEQERAKRLLPKLAQGGLVFLFAPQEEWIQRDPWVTASAD